MRVNVTAQGLVAPANTLATSGRDASQVIASSTRVWPRSRQNLSKRSTIAQLASVIY